MSRVNLSKSIKTPFGDNSGNIVEATTDYVNLNSVSLTDMHICITIYPACGGSLGYIERTTLPKGLSDAAKAFESAIAQYVAGEVTK